MNFKLRKQGRYRALALLLIFCPVNALGSEPFGIQGQFGLHYDMYNYSAFAYENFRPRFPSDLARFSAHATITAGEHLSIPFRVDITNQGASYHLPTLPEERLIDYVQNPRNNISVNPTYKWATAYIGTQNPGFSALTTGDIPIFGAGLKVNPGRFLFSAHYGRSQLAVNANPAENIAGAYEQRILASRVGFGSEDGTRLILNMVYRNDEESSVSIPPAGIHPQQGITVSPLLQIKVSGSVMFSTETAGSVFTRDLHGPILTVESDILNQVDYFVKVNGSTNMDFSNISSLEWKSDRISLGAEIRYIGAGFEPVGYRAMERDLIDYNLRGSFRLWNDRLHVNGTAGIRENNLSETRAESTTRLIANLNLFAQITEVLNINSTYSNFGFRNNVLTDTLKVEMIQNMISITPGIQLNRDERIHSISATVNLQLFDEFNVVTGDFVNTRSTGFNFSYNLLFSEAPFNAGFMGMYLQNQTPGMDLDLYHAGINARYRFLQGRITPSVMLAHSGITREGFTTDYRYLLSLRTDYKITETMNLRFGYTYSNYKYGTARPGARTNEHRIQLSVSQRF